MNRFSGHVVDSASHFTIECTTTKIENVGNVVLEISNIHLKLADLASRSGQIPCMFSMSADGTILFVRNEDGEKVIVALRREQNGSLSKFEGYIPYVIFDPEIKWR